MKLSISSVSAYRPLGFTQCNKAWLTEGAGLCYFNISSYLRSCDKLFYQMIEEVKRTTRHFNRLTQIVGKKNIGIEIESPFDFISIANKGITVTIIRNFMESFKIPLGTTAELLDISEPTLYRWFKSNKTLDRNFSVKLLDIIDLFVLGAEVFEGQENFMKWIDLANTAIGGLKPKELIEIPGGISKVKDLLGRIEYGVYS
jgi:putative toxin-antitoxin system antitoxin component (TIGR02293 family)